MTLTVSVSDFRNNLASYLARVSQGSKIVIKDDKKGIEFAEVIKKQAFSKESYLWALKNARGIFTKEKHPEWSSVKKIESWLRKTRKQSDRTINL